MTYKEAQILYNYLWKQIRLQAHMQSNKHAYKIYSSARIVYLITQACGKRKYIVRFEIIYFYIISNLTLYFHCLTEWWRTHSNVLA